MDHETSNTPAREDDPAPQPLRKLARWLIGLLVAGALVNLLAVLADLDQYDVFTRLDGGEDVSFEEATGSDNRTAVAGIAQFVVYFTSVVVWLVWFRRAYVNTTRISDHVPRYGRGWAVGAWFVPFLNLVRPKKIANDIWRAGDPAPDGPFLERPVSVVLHVWWAIWLLDNTVANVATRLLFRAETVPDQASAAALLAVSDGIAVVSALFAAWVVRATTRRYEARRAQVEREAGEATAGSAVTVSDPA